MSYGDKSKTHFYLYKLNTTILCNNYDNEMLIHLYFPLLSFQVQRKKASWQSLCHDKIIFPFLCKNKVNTNFTNEHELLKQRIRVHS